MIRFRYRAAIDMEIGAAGHEEAEANVPIAKEYLQGLLATGSGVPRFELLGLAEIEKLNPDALEKAAPIVEKFDDLTLMSVQYRGENFTALCRTEILKDDFVSVKPIALMLTEEKLDHVRDVDGNAPREGRRKKLNLEN